MGELRRGCDGREHESLLSRNRNACRPNASRAVRIVLTVSGVVVFGIQPESKGTAMSIWVSVYCRKRIGAIDPETLVAEIRERATDFSEFFAQEDPEETLSSLRVEERDRLGLSSLLWLHFLKDGPPVVIDSATEPEQVMGEIQEYLEERFGGRTGEKASFVRSHLCEVVEIIHFCLKQRHADGMGTPLVYAAAAWLADTGVGLVRADSQGWMQLENWGEFTVIEPE